METPPHQPFGLTLLVDKPFEWTSFDVVNKIRYAAKKITGQKKIKVGHAGTLDPLATGLMIVCVGKHTKLIADLMGLPKQYTGSFMLGATTPSYDLELAIDKEYPLPQHDPQLFKTIAQSFVGKTMQTPPLFSAKKIDGQKAYHLARKGKDIVLPKAPIEVTRFDVDSTDFPAISFVLDCSKGTYVRSLAHDFGLALHSGAHLISLRRTAIGPHSIEQALDIERAIAAIETAHLNYEQ